MVVAHEQPHHRFFSDVDSYLTLRTAVAPLLEFTVTAAQPSRSSTESNQNSTGNLTGRLEFRASFYP